MFLSVRLKDRGLFSDLCCCCWRIWCRKLPLFFAIKGFTFPLRVRCSEKKREDFVESFWLLLLHPSLVSRNESFHLQHLRSCAFQVLGMKLWIRFSITKEEPYRVLGQISTRSNLRCVLPDLSQCPHLQAPGNQLKRSSIESRISRLLASSSRQSIQTLGRVWTWWEESSMKKSELQKVSSDPLVLVLLSLSVFIRIKTQDMFSDSLSHCSHCSYDGAKARTKHSGSRRAPWTCSDRLCFRFKGADSASTGRCQSIRELRFDVQWDRKSAAETKHFECFQRESFSSTRSRHLQEAQRLHHYWLSRDTRRDGFQKSCSRLLPEFWSNRLETCKSRLGPATSFW